MAILLVLMLLAPLLARGLERRAALLFAGTTVLLLVLPILVSQYDYRFTIPAFGPLAAAAAIGAAAIWDRRGRLVDALRTRRSAPAA